MYGARENNLRGASLRIPKRNSSGLFGNDKPIARDTDQELDALLYGADVRVSFGEFGSKYEGLVERLTRLYLKKDAAAMSDRNRAAFERFTSSQACRACGGDRLNRAALDCKIGGRNVAELSDFEATALVEAVRGLDDPIGAKPAAKLVERLRHLVDIGLGVVERLRHLVDIGLGYLSLSREAATLSGASRSG